LIASVAIIITIVVVIFGEVGGFNGALLILIFYAVVPTVNAAFDWSSWIATRRLLSRLAGVRGIFVITGHAVLDLFFAILFLAGLSVVLPFFIEITNVVFAAMSGPNLEWRLMLGAAIDDPLGGGILVTGMLLTTLIPTVLHLSMALVALLVPRLDVDRPSRWYPFHGSLLSWVTNPDPDPDYFQRTGVAIWLFGNFVVSWTFLMILGAAIYAFISAFGPTGGQILLDLANFGASLAGG